MCIEREGTARGGTEDKKKKKSEDSEKLSHSSLMTFCVTGSWITEIYS